MKKKDLVKQKFLSFIIIGIIILLSACTLVGPQKKSPSGSTNVSRKIGFEERKAEDLLKNSISIPYPDGKIFTPTALSNDGIAYGEAVDKGHEDQNYLASMNLHTKDFQKIKDVEKTSNLTHVAVSYVDHDIVVFEEYDQLNQTGIYYLWKIKDKSLTTLIDRRPIGTVPVTQVARSNQKLFINYEVGDSLYQIEEFDLETGVHQTIESENSGFPNVFKNYLYYVQIDNTALTTKIVAYSLSDGQKKVIDQTKDDQRYYVDLLTNGHNLLYLVANNKDASFTFENKNHKKIFSTSQAETSIYRNIYLTYMGERRSEERVKSQYYLWDLKHRIHYLYDHGPILLSDKGVLWIQFKKKDSEIPKGEIYRNENSVMRYQEW